MSKKAPKARRQASATRRPPRGAPPRAPQKQYPNLLWIAGSTVAAAVLIFVAFIAIGGGQSSPPRTHGGPPPGTKTYIENQHGHVLGHVHYDHIPPVGGNHNPTWLNCGVYIRPVPNENAVHSLEHGAVWITYRPNLSPADVNRLEKLVVSEYIGPERYVLMSPYPGLPAPVVASAWGKQLRVQSANDPRIKQFIEYFREGAQGGEPGRPCSGGIGNPVA